MTEASAIRANLSTTTLLLTYPHLVSGTLPLNKPHAPLLPARARRADDGNFG